jgi:hypothetical protein
MNVYKVELLIIDFDDIGEDAVKNMIENTKYPNHCISPQVKSIQTRQVEWCDAHPLNSSFRADAEYKRLFG